MVGREGTDAVDEAGHGDPQRCAYGDLFMPLRGIILNIGLTLEQRNRVDAVSAAEGTTPTEFARAAILEAVQLHHALTAEEREQVSHAAEAEGLSLAAFCRSAILEAAAPAEHGAGIDADGVGFLAWLMAVLSATRRGHATRA